MTQMCVIFVRCFLVYVYFFSFICKVKSALFNLHVVMKILKEGKERKKVEGYVYYFG